MILSRTKYAKYRSIVASLSLTYLILKLFEVNAQAAQRASRVQAQKAKEAKEELAGKKVHGKEVGFPSFCWASTCILFLVGMGNVEIRLIAQWCKAI